MRARDLAVLLQRNETTVLGGFVSSDPVSVRRMGLATSRRDGVLCLSCREAPIQLLHRVIGIGTLGPASQPTLDRVLRHYDGRGLVPRVEVAEGVAPRSLEPLLRRNGFAEEEGDHLVHVLQTDRAPDVPAAAGLRIEMATRRTAGEFGRLIRTGFAADGPVGDLFDRASAAAVRRMPSSRFVSLIARVDGRPAGTAMLWCSPRVAGLYSGSVLDAFRGRGIQKALIAERVRLGLERGRRVFTSQTAGDGPSAHNLHDLGFRVLYRARYFTRH